MFRLLSCLTTFSAGYAIINYVFFFEYLVLVCLSNFLKFLMNKNNLNIKEHDRYKIANINRDQLN